MNRKRSLRSFRDVLSDSEQQHRDVIRPATGARGFDQSMALRFGAFIAGQDLFVACNASGSIARVTMASDFRSGKLLSNAPNPKLAFPTAIAIDGDSLLVVNAQLNALAPGKSPSVPFTVTRLPIADLR